MIRTEWRDKENIQQMSKNFDGWMIQQMEFIK